MKNQSTSLDEVKRFILANFDLSEILAIILVGSYAKGRERKASDIDIIIFKKNQPSVIERQEIRFHEYELDIRLYRQAYFEETFQKKATTSNQLGEISLFLRFLREAVIWYQEESYLDKFKSSAQMWNWKPEYTRLLEFPCREPRTKWAKKAFDEHLNFLEVAKRCLKNGTPISHRQKDYPELMVIFKENEAKILMKLTSEAYSELEIKREWTEYKDAKKAITYKEWGVAVASLKDVLKFLIRSVQNLSHIQLLDPVIWRYAEEGKLPTSLRKALEYIYNDKNKIII